MEVETIDDVSVEELVDGEDGSEAVEIPPTKEAAGIGRKKNSRRVRTNSKEGSVTVSVANISLTPRTWKNSRRPRNRYGRGLPKKGGAGGKGVWGAPGSELLETYEDQNDPNYDSESFTNGDIKLKEVIPEISDEEVKKKLGTIILEYFEHGDTHEVALSLDEFLTSSKCPLVVRVSIEIALDHKPSHREMISRLISDLYGHILTEKDISHAFDALLTDLPDLILDTPDAAHVLGNYIARAIADDCLPPKYVNLYKTNPPQSEQAAEALKRADTLLSMKHGLVRLDNVWGVGGGLRPVKYLIRQIHLLLEEFLSSGDINEAIRCLNSLEVPHFHHELVYEAVLMAIEATKPEVVDAMCKLLKALSDALIITPKQMEQGYQRVFDDMGDIVLDVPLAYINLDKFIEKCYKERFLSEAILKNVPNRGRKRFVSEGDGGHIKGLASTTQDH